MKSFPVIVLFLLSLFVYSCKDTLTDIGSGIQPTSDQIKIGTDTFHLSTDNYAVEAVYAKPDSFLLGSYYNTKFGSTQADVLAQLNCPVGFTFPPLSVPDSASVIIVYNSWTGVSESPMEISIYEMNKKTFDYFGIYPSNLNPSDYTDHEIYNPTNLLAKKIIKAKDKYRTDSTAIRLSLPQEFVTRFFNSSHYNSTADFLKFFKGMYITTNYGASTLLNVSQINMSYYYHYTYTSRNIHGGDSIVTVKNTLYFPANAEVRQVNRFVHADRSSLAAAPDSINYVASPANWNTKVGVPLSRIKQRMDAGIAGKKLTVNSALLRVEATDIDVDTISAPTVRYMLLIKESAVDRFFKNRELPSDTCAVLAQHAAALILNSTTNYQHYYSFNVAKLIANELKIAAAKGIAPSDRLNMRLIPVQVTLNSSSAVTAVKQEYLMSAVSIRSGKNTHSPMRINVVYTGF
ncbi:MAG: DUF4270 domain-containing protein [Paludibacter sp.]|nr:DUF4270 domain-containing protein [Paludibacter sp.]